MKPCAAFAAAAAALLALTGGAALAGSAAAATGTGCSVTYTVQSQWTGGFTAAVAVTNLGPALRTWSLAFSFPNESQKVTQGWSAAWMQSGTRVTASNLDWNGSLATGAGTAIGFVGAWNSTNPVPTSFTLNGTTCNGPVISTTKPTTTTTATTTTTRPTTTTTTRPTTTTTTTTAQLGTAPELRVSGNKIVTSDGRPYRLLGVNRSSGEFACVQGKGMWDGAPSGQSGIDAMKTWNVHAVRIPLNEECWLGLNGSPSGPAYQQEVKAYADALIANGITPILDLHWNQGAFTTGPSWACTDVHATCQKPVPDAEFAPQFWSSVASTFKGNDAVVFDLFNEPWPEFGNGSDATSGWLCLRDGGTCPGISYPVAGMQDLVDAVRATGASNILLISGLEWTNNLTRWLEYKPNDPLQNLAAAWHVYSFNACVTAACWDQQIAPVAAQVPVVIGETGQDNCGYDFVDRVLTWADQHGLSYLPWTWNPWGCTTGAVLIKDWAGTPEPGIGDGYRTHLRAQDPYQ